MVRMKTKETGGATPMRVQRSPVKAPPKTSFGAALQKKTEQLAQQEQEKELLEQVGAQMSRSVVDMPDGANIETEKVEDEGGEGW